MHRRERNLSGAVRRYNLLVQEIVVLISAGRAPRRTVAPRRLDPRRLFNLDVDDDIWQPDPGLGPQGEHDLPRWQTDQMVRDGINLMLEARRYREEKERLVQEACAMCSWVQEVATQLSRAIDSSSSGQ